MDNNISKKEKLKVIIEKYLQLQLLIKNFSTYDINFNKNIFDICVSEIRFLLNEYITNLDEHELKELINHFNGKYYLIKKEIAEQQTNVIFIDSENIFEKIENLEKYKNLCIEYDNKHFKCSFYFETIRKLKYYLDLKNNDIAQAKTI